MKFLTKTQLKWYFTWLASCYLLLTLIGVALLSTEGVNWRESLDLLLPHFRNPGLWLFLSIPYLGFLLLRYLFSIYKKAGFRTFAKKLGMLVLLPAALLFSAFKISDWYTGSEQFDYTWDYEIENSLDSVRQFHTIDGKYRGVHLFGTRRLEFVDFDPLVKNNIEWIVLVPYGWQEDHRSTSIRWQGRRRQSQAERDSSMILLIEKARHKGIQTIIKPHIWLGRPSPDKWRSDIEFEKEEEWASWSKDYREWILHYARLSEALQLPLFCIGTELFQLVKTRPDFWRNLIRDIRKVYSGKLTYAANWHDEYEAVDFWGELDYIGIQAYFPLTNKQNPGTEDLVRGWKPHLKALQAFSKKYDKPILFTEIGYKSTPDAAIEPWQWANTVEGMYTKISNETQVNCYEAFFKAVWPEPWFAGALLWQWHARHYRDERDKDINFTPQNKPAENIIARWFNKVVKKKS